MPVKRVKRESDDFSSPPPKKSARTAKRTAPKEEPQSDHANGGVAGLRICCTGITELLTRDLWESKLKQAGASVTSAVSGVTNILLHGPTLEDGRDYKGGSKYKKAEELIASGKSKGNLRILSEEDFLKAYPEFRPQRPGGGSGGATDSSVPELSTLSTHFMWSEKWRPKGPAEFAFNLAAYQSLENWLKTWTSTQDDEKGALLCGPPGIGKTSAVLALAETLGYKLTEFNASDSRGQKQLKALHALISGGASLSKGEVHEKLLILMDEADGLSSGDRGGAQELVKLLKISRIPIICTCNDKQHPKVRTLAKSCRVIAFQKPEKLAAVDRAQRIAKKEGFNVEERFVHSLYDASGGDMRQLLNGLQMALLGTLNSTTSGDLRKFVLKDLNTSDDAFASVRRLFIRSDMSDSERLTAFFTDYDLIPLLVSENYIRMLPSKGVENLPKVVQVADSISYAILIDSIIRGKGQWDFLPDYGWFSTVFPTKLITGSTFHGPMFPKALGRISSTNKHRRQFAELSLKTGRAGRRIVADGYYELLGHELVKPLRESDVSVSERIEEFYEAIREYGLTKDLVVENLMETRVGKAGDTPYDKVDTKTKSALTRADKSFVAPGQVASSHRARGTGAAPKKGGAKAKSRAKKGTASASSSVVASQSPNKSVEQSETEEEIDLENEKQEEEARMATIF